MSDQFIYDAFISYRHAETDKFVAERLHKKLESLRLPRNISRLKKEGEKTRIRRIFRDKEELPIASDLATPIMTALQKSEFLIVICSPRVRESEWVKREITSFIEMHGRERILAVLIEGEPSEAFPPELMYADQEIELPDGTKEVRRVSVEPLAADVRGKSHRAIGKKVDEELLRIAAPMFHCGYDELRQRHREQKIKNTLRFLFLACLFFWLFGGFATYQGSQIQKQSEQIKKQSAEIEQKANDIQTQSEQIREQSEEIRKQSNELKQQYNDILRTNLLHTADDALRLLASGDRISSVNTALTCLPTKEHQDYPLLEHTYYALAEATYAYDDGSTIKASSVLQHETAVNSLIVSPNGTRILTIDDTGTAHVFDSSNSVEIATFLIDLTYTSIYSNSLVTFLSESDVLIKLSDRIERYDYTAAQTKWQMADLNGATLQFTDDYSLLAINVDDEIRLVDATAGTVLSTISLNGYDENLTPGTTLVFNEDNSLLAFSAVHADNSESKSVLIYDMNQGEVIDRITADYPSVTHLTFSKSRLIINFYRYDTNNEILTNRNYTSHLVAYDIQEKRTLWERSLNGKSVNKLACNPRDDAKLYVTTYSMLYAFDIANGDILSENEFNSELISVFFVPTSNYCYCLTRDGRFSTVVVDLDYLFEVSFESTSNNLMAAYFRQKSDILNYGFVVALPYSSRQVHLFSSHNNLQDNELLKAESDISMVQLNQKGDTVCVLLEDVIEKKQTVQVFDYPSCRHRFDVSVDSTFKKIQFVGLENETLCCISDGYIAFYSCTDGTLVKQIDLSGHYESIKQISYDEVSGKLYIERFSSFLVIDTNRQTEAELSTNADEQTVADKKPAPILQAKSFAAGNQSVYLCNTAEKRLERYSEDISTLLTSKPINTSYVDHIFVNETGSLLFVVYKNNKTEVYSGSDLTLLSEYDGIEFAPEYCITLTDGTDDYLLMSGQYVNRAYLCSKNHQVRAYIRLIHDFDLATNKIISCDDDTVYTAQLLTASELIDIAERLIATYEAPTR